MKDTLPPILAAASLLLVATLWAGEISVYKDKDGVITLTDRPVPAGIRVEQVIQYEDRALDERRPPQENGGDPASDQAPESRRIQDLKERAEFLREEAEKARALAREKIKAAEVYLEGYRQRKRSKRRRYQKEAQRITHEAEKAQARANAAIERANQAMEAARKATDARPAKTR